MEQYFKLNAELERLEKLALGRPQGMTEDLRKKIQELRTIQNQIRSLLNMVEEAHNALSSAFNNLERSKKNEENILEQIRNAQLLHGYVGIDRLESNLKYARETLEKDRNDYFAAQVLLNRRENILKNRLQRESELRKGLEYELSDNVIPIDGGGNNDEDIWKEKYLKYKAKYLKLKSL